MPVGTKATVKARRPGRAARRSARTIVLGNTYHLHFRPGEDADRRARRPARVHGVGRPDPHRLGRLPGLLAPRHAARGRTTTASRSAPSTTARPSASRPSSPRAIQARARLRHRDVPRHLPARRRPARRARGGRPPNDALGRSASATCRARPASSLRDHPGRPRHRAPPSLERRARRRSTSTATRSAASASARTAAPMFDATVARGVVPARREAALLHGHRRPRGRDRGDRARRRHVRLRPADPHGAHRQRAHAGRAAQPAERPLRPRSAPARRVLRAAPPARGSAARTSGISSTSRRFSAFAS